jgi:hypothetical protein
MKRGALLIISVLVLAGGVGWYVWDQNKKDTKAENSTKTTSPTAQTQSNSATYLKIPEKGIKFELTPKIQDAYYFINNEGSIYISVHRFDNTNGEGGCTAKGKYGNGGGIAQLRIAKPGDNNEGSSWTQQQLEIERNTTKAIVINGTYYWFAPIKAYCVDVNDPNSSKIDSEVGNLEQEFKKVQETIRTI